MKYRDAIAYLNGFINFEKLSDSSFDSKHRDIDRFTKLLNELGNPHSSYRIIHIAGTKGKGSTAAILSAALRASNYKVGLYTSPHLISVRERIRINDRQISKREFARIISQIENISFYNDEHRSQSFRTVFEHLTAAAFLYFAREKVDIAIIEAGLGGKLDATIVVNPILSILTPIGLDHTQILGDTISAIAADKASVIKKSIPVVSAPQKAEAMNELKKRAEEVHSRMICSPARSELKSYREEKGGYRFRSVQGWLENVDLYLNLLGLYQLDNVSTVLTALNELREQGLHINAETVRKGLSKVQWSGRFQLISGQPAILLDGAHNVISLLSLLEAVKEITAERKIRVIFSSMRSKPAEQMVEMLSEVAVKIYLAPIAFPKGFTAAELRTLSANVSTDVSCHDDIPSAFDCAMREADEDEIVLVTGSLYLVGELLRHLNNLPPPPADGSIDDRI